MLQGKLPIPMCMFWCFFKPSFVENDFSHSEHKCKFCSLCTTECLPRSRGRVNFASQRLQEIDLSSEWTILWDFSSKPEGKAFPHRSQIKGRSRSDWLWILSWYLMLCLRLNTLWQMLQLYLFLDWIPCCGKNWISSISWTAGLEEEKFVVIFTRVWAGLNPLWMKTEVKEVKHNNPSWWDTAGVKISPYSLLP